MGLMDSFGQIEVVLENGVYGILLERYDQSIIFYSNNFPRKFNNGGHHQTT